MKRLFATGLLVIVATAAAYIVFNRPDAAPGAAPELAGAPSTASVLARGEYLTTAADCIACHTVADSAKPFAGGVPFKLPVGVIYSTNITADPATGIGRWSDEDFVHAVRDGIGKGGEHLYPAFPYTSYTQLSRGDVLAIKAYLMSMPAMRQTNRPNALRFPFNQRWAIGFWNAAFFKNRRFVADAAKSPDWNRGAYLATALGHCGECHTPRNIAFGLEHGDELAGAELQGWRAYNITSDMRYGIGAWSDSELHRYLATGLGVAHGSASGPMGEAVANSLQYLHPQDISSMVAYLRSVPARKGKQLIAIDRMGAPSSVSTDLGPLGDAAPPPVAGLKLFEGACASCHAWNGAGRQSPYAALIGNRSVNDPTGANVTQAILRGAQQNLANGDVYMPAFGDAYSDIEVAELTNYVIAHFGAKRGEVTPDAVAKRRDL
ncbi:MAG: cytochrome c [Steroidobacteraceae bacterium]